MGLYRVTIAGLYEWNNTLFDKMEFPESADKQNFIDSLLLSYGDCEPLYPDWEFMYNSAIPAWSKKWKSSIEKERFRFEWVSASEGEKFQKTMEEFEKTVSKLGPLNLE